MTDGPAEEPDQDEFDNHRSMFASDLAPSVGIGGVDIFRSTITYSEDSARDDALQWRISGFAGGSESHPMTLMGDLFCTSESWFVGVTVVTLLSFRDGYNHDFEDDDANQRLTEALAPWASNVLYDAAAGVARTMVATNHQCQIDVPVATPRAAVRYLSDTADEDEEGR